MNTDTWSVLSENANKRRRFDPSDKADLKEFSYFIKHNRWKNGCPFYVEWPYRDIISMCQSKYTKFMLEKLTK